MSKENPYEPPKSEVHVPTQPTGLIKRLGTAVLLIGAAVLLYGVTACWLVPNLPPNTPSSRLPSIIVLAVGGGLALLGLTMQSVATPKKDKPDGIPTYVGLLILLAVIVGMATMFFIRASVR